MSPLNNMLVAPLSPGENGFHAQDLKDFNPADEVIDTEPLDHRSPGADFAALVHSPVRDDSETMERPMTAPPQSYDHGLHDMQQQSQAMAFGANHNGMQPSMMWNMDSGVSHPGEKPKRPLSAYNFYFQLERERIIKGDIKDKDAVGEYTLEDVARIALVQQKKAKENKPKEKRSHRKTHGKISFGDLARTIANKWKKLDDKTKSIFEGSASIEKERYKKELGEWNKQQKKWKDATARMAGMAPMMYPGGAAGGFGIVTPTQMPKKTLLGAGSADLSSSSDALAVARMNQQLMSEYSERSAASVRSHPSMMAQQSSSKMMEELQERRTSTGGMGVSQGQHYNMDFLDDGMNDYSFQNVADNTFNAASATLTPSGSPDNYHNRAIISQQRQMQVMLMQRQQKQLQQQIMEQERSSSAALMQHQMMMINQYNGGNSGMDQGAFRDNSNKSAEGSYAESPESFHHPIGDFGSNESHHNQA